MISKTQNVTFLKNTQTANDTDNNNVLQYTSNRNDMILYKVNKNSNTTKQIACEKNFIIHY